MAESKKQEERVFSANHEDFFSHLGKNSNDLTV